MKFPVGRCKFWTKAYQVDTTDLGVTHILNEQERGDRGKCIEKVEIDQYIGDMDTR